MEQQVLLLLLERLAVMDPIEKVELLVFEFVLVVLEIHSIMPSKI